MVIIQAINISSNSVLACLEDPDIGCLFSDRARGATTIWELRRRFAHFLRTNQALHNNKAFQDAKKVALQARRARGQNSWEEVLVRIETYRNDTSDDWADEFVVMCMATFLRKEIWQVSSTSKEGNAWGLIGGIFDGWHETALGTPITLGYLPQRHWEAVQHRPYNQTGSDCMVCGKSFRYSLYQHLKTYSPSCQRLYNMQRLEQEAEERNREKHKERNREQRQQISDEEKEVMRLKDKGRKGKQRQQMSDEEKKDTKLKDKGRKAKQRQQLSDEEKKNKNVKNKERNREQRQQMSDEEKKDMNVKNKERNREQRQQMSDEEKKDINVKNKERNREQRQQMSDEEKKDMYVKNKERKREHRQQMSDEEMKDRQLEDRERKARKKQEMSREAKDEVMRIKREKKKAKYDQMSKKEKKDFNRRQNQKKKDAIAKETAEDRYIKMHKALKDTWTTACVCCHKKMSNTKTKRYSGSDMKEFNIEKVFEKLMKELEKELFKTCIQTPGDPLFPKQLREMIEATKEIHLCTTCDQTLRLKKRMPAQCANNKLQVDKLPDADQEKLFKDLNELEKTLIARNIVFLKIFEMPKSRWPKVIDKCVNVLLNCDDLLKTLNTLCPLPRNPEDAGLIEVTLKRKLEYKN